MEEVACLLCGARVYRVRYWGHDRLHQVPGKFQLVECRSCGFWYLSPRPDKDEIGRYYPAEYLPFRPSLHEEKSLLRRQERRYGLHRRCKVVRQHVPEGHLLDIGCGTGDFLAVMATYPGWTVEGLEPHAAAAQRAREQYGLTITQGDLDDKVFPNETFDAVTLWDVLEHVPRPLDTLRTIRRVLRPGGHVIIGLPNRDSIDARLFGQYWAGLDVPRHFSVFNETNITTALVQSGFARPTTRNLNGGFHSFALSVRFWLSSKDLSEWQRRMVLTSLYSLPFRLTTLFYFSLLKTMRLGSTMVVAAERLA